MKKDKESLNGVLILPLFNHTEKANAIASTQLFKTMLNIG